MDHTEHLSRANEYRNMQNYCNFGMRAVKVSVNANATYQSAEAKNRTSLGNNSCIRLYRDYNCQTVQVSIAVCEDVYLKHG
jgi:hypothetical protein